MKTLAALKLRPKRLAVLIGALGLACHGVHAQQHEQHDVRGKMIDRSTTVSLSVPSSSETESPAFDHLAPSALTLEERKLMLETPPPRGHSQQTLTIEDQLNAANFDSGKAVLLAPAKKALDALIVRVRNKQNVHFQIAGHTDNQRIAAWLRPVFPDNQALSEARALAVAAYLKERLQLPASAFTVRGFGDTIPIASNDTPQGMAKNRRTKIRVWYQEPVELPPPVPPKSAERIVARDACAPDAAHPDLPFSISVDGRPLQTDTVQREADRQRCVDVALEKADVQIKYDPFNVAPALNVWSVPAVAVRSKALQFSSYTNYAWWLRRAEVRVFAKGQNTQETPFAVVPLAVGGTARWQVPANAPEDMGYLLRVYDENGSFDETAIKPLRLLDRVPLHPESNAGEKRNGWGENTLRLKNIPASGGSVTVSGTRVKPGQRVSALGMPVPVDAKGSFVLRQILPAGPHSVDVSIKDADGVGATFRRNLSIADHDWFYIAMADLTVGRDHTSGPAALVTADSNHYNNETWVDGRGAFYLKGKIKGKYLLTASADTREQPFKDLFTNFQAKTPDYLLRRIDPDKYYPVYGDDSTIVDDAPTQGKLYVKLQRGGSYAMWGNFQTAWSGTELTQYTRGLYGANLVWKSDASTGQGEKNTDVNLFAAEPGTLQSREEFRGTGGSLYYLHQQDITEGSEQLWVEIRDKDSGLVIQRTRLAPAQDYEIDYLQGRLTLRAPLPSVADGSTLIQTSTLNGNPVYLVATYEYVPGFSAVSGNAVGLRASHWFNDGIRLGMSSYHQGSTGSEQTLKGVDATLRYKPGTWLKAEVARSTGVGSTSLTSITGGFDFNQAILSGAPADARRVDAAVDLAELGGGLKGRLSAYWQERDAGFSGPGQATPNGEAIRQNGVAAAVPLSERTEIAVKNDSRNALSQSAHATEAALRHKINPEWGVSAGVRHDQRSNAATAGVTNASPTLNRNGDRNDLVLRFDYRPLAGGEMKKAAATAAGATAATAAPTPVSTAAGTAGPASMLVPATPANASESGMRPMADPTAAAGIAAARTPGLQYDPWNMYGFVQHTLSRSGDRLENDRAGIGSGWQVNDRLRLGTEVSGGSGGIGGQLSGAYRMNERSDLYLAYAMETESEDINYSGRQGTLTAGSHYRVNDRVGLFGETRWANGAGPQSLTHAFGVDLAPDPHWTTGIKFETGTLSDPVAGDLKRHALGLSATYKFDRTKFATALEYRVDTTTSLGTVNGTCSSPALATACTDAAASSDRRSWLTRNTLGYQIDPDWRLIGKLNLARSVSSQGAFYDGDYTELVFGAAYRPVDNDRWNALFKYTYFYNLPSPGQVDSVLGSPLDYTQKSHVLNADFIYDLRPWVSVGAKYGIRFGELMPSKTAGTWFSSRADLVVLRADFHWVREWDALLEARRLDAKEAADARSGFLAGIYRHVGEHAKIGVGYNFTDFSDDLTDLSYRSRGWYMNVLGTF